MRTTDLLNLGGLNGPLHADYHDPADTSPQESPRSQRLLIRIKPAEGRDLTGFAALMDELEERFLATQHSAGSDAHIRTFIVSLWGDKRPLLETTLTKHGFCIKDEREL